MLCKVSIVTFHTPPSSTSTCTKIRPQQASRFPDINDNNLLTKPRHTTFSSPAEQVDFDRSKQAPEGAGMDSTIIPNMSHSGSIRLPWPGQAVDASSWSRHNKILGWWNYCTAFLFPFHRQPSFVEVRILSNARRNHQTTDGQGFWIH